jgi:KDO2-lipid IV(A) lauroyltransferase
MRQVLGRRATASQVRSLARRSVRNYARYMVEFLRFPTLSREEILAKIGIDRWDRFDTLLSEGRGVLFVGLHMGNWDLAGAAAGIRGYPFWVVADVIQPPALNEEIQGVRRRQGMHILPMENAARGLLKALKAGEMVGLLIDRPSPDDGVPVRFFGGTAYVPAGAATLALRTNARVIPAAVLRRPDQRFDLVLDDDFRYDPSGDREADVRELTQAIMTSLEGMVRATPEQWYMFRPMWPAATDAAGYRQPQRAALGADA